MDQVETRSGDQQLHLSLSRLKTFEKCNSSSSSNLSLTDARKTKLVKAGFYYNDRDDSVKCFMCNLTIHSLNNNDNDDDYYIKHHREKNPDCSFIRNAQHRRIKTFHSVLNLNYEKDRLHTFLDWPIPHIINEKTLAENGFYYLKQKDYCACAFCKKIIGDWRVGDDVAQEHEKYSPRCHFVKELQSPAGDDKPTLEYCDILNLCQLRPTTGNIPMEHCDILDRYKLRYRGEEGSLSLRKKEEIMGIENSPREYKNITERINSFNDHYDDDVVAKNYYPSWSADRVKQTPEELAKAGFYYVKVGGDMVKCFYCGGGVYNWEIDDDPIKLHYMYFGHCKFIKSIVEEQQQQQNGYPSSSVSSSSLLNNESSSSSSSNNQNFVNVPVKIDDKDMDILMQNNVCARLKVFHDKDAVRYMLGDRLSKTGAPFFSIHDFDIEYYIRGNIKQQASPTPAEEMSTTTTRTIINVEKYYCRICKDKLTETVFLPCTHMVTCFQCATSLYCCPICSGYIKCTVNPIF